MSFNDTKATDSDAGNVRDPLERSDPRPVREASDQGVENEQRNPIESIASNIVESIRDGHGELQQDDEQTHPDEVNELLPLIQRLEKARVSQVQRPNGLASLGADRPDQLGDFRLVRQIGRGGMGVVFEAMQHSLGRRVAVKVLPKSLLSDEVQLKRFQREARTAAALHHTNIVPVFGVGEDQGFHYYVMQRIDGRGLDRVMVDRDGPLQIDEVVHLGHQAAVALSYAHSQKVLHRDIKPANLIVNDQNELWVTDFGVAKAIESEAVTRTGDVIGTLRYMAPEQILGATDVRSDIYSLGVTLYELLAGQPAVDDAAIRSAIVSRRPAPTPKPLRQLNAQVPRDLETILQSAMSPTPARRYQSAADMAGDLQRFADGESISVRRESVLEKTGRWAARNPALAALTALSLLLLVGVAAISSVGYFRIQDALGREQVSRRNAEETSALAVGALDQVFDRFTSTTQTETQFSTTPTLSTETAELLEDLLHYFDALAARGHSDPDSMVKAHYGIGHIRFQLGQYQRSIASLKLALKQAVKNGALDAIREAQIRNRIGYAHRMLDEIDEAQAQHELALARLEGIERESIDGQSPEVQMELARTHFLFGVRVQPGMQPNSMPPRVALSLESGRPERPRRFDPDGPGPRPGGPFPPGLVGLGGPRWAGDVMPNQAPSFLSELYRPNTTQTFHLNAAIGLLRDLRERNPGDTKYGVALAACLRALGADSLSKRTDKDIELEKEAFQILRGLNESDPNDETVLSELSSALTEFTVFEPMSRTERFEAVERCREAVEYCELLVTSHPNVPSYNNALVHTLFRLGYVLEHMAKREAQGRSFEEEAGDAFERAARHHSVLLRQHPNEVGYLAWHAVLLLRLGDNAFRTGKHEAAETALLASAKTWSRLCDEHSSQEISWEAIPSVYQYLSKVQHMLGKHAEAKKSLVESEVRRLYLDLGKDK